MSAAARDRKVQILRLSVTTGAYQEDVEAWPSIGSRLASRRDASGGEALRAAALGGKLTARFRMLQDSFTRTITVEDRLQDGARIYDITDVREVFKAGRGARELEFDAVARAEGSA